MVEKFKRAFDVLKFIFGRNFNLHNTMMMNAAGSDVDNVETCHLVKLARGFHYCLS